MSSSIPKNSIVLTRSIEDSLKSAPFFERAGFRVLSIPVISIQPLEVSDSLRIRLTEIGKSRFNWIIFTSKNGVGVLSDMLGRIGEQSVIPSGTRICAVGPAAAQAVSKAFNRTPELVPEKERGEGILEEFAHRPPGTIFYPRAEVTATDLVGKLKDAGHAVFDEPIYKTVEIEWGREELEKLAQVEPDTLIIFFSPSAFKAMLRQQPQILRRAKIASIGPTTSEAIRAAGLSIFFESSSKSAENVAAELAAFVEKV